MRRFLAWVALLGMTMIQFLPLTALAAEKGTPPTEPYEKVSTKSGSWYESRIDYGGKSNLIIGYKGDYETWAEEPSLRLSISEDTILTGIYIPYEGAESGYAELTLEDSRGNVYQGFYVEHTLTGGIGEKDKFEDTKDSRQNSLYEFIPESELILKKGDYTLYIEGDDLPIDAYLVKGYNYAAYKRYKDELIKWAQEEEGRGPVGHSAGVGYEELSELYKQFIEGSEGNYEYEPPWDEEPQEFYSPMFSLDEEYVIDEIVLSTWNGGYGKHPGNISICNEAGEMVASYKAQGASQGGVPNTLWVIMPGITLTAGTYFLDMDAPEALDFDDSGEPLFYVGVSTPAVPPTDFTGTYKIWLDLYKTHTLMGLVESKKSSFSLEDYELSVLDKGTVVELAGQYEGMPFSQNCDVIEREEDYVVVQFDFNADLTKLPYKAKISAAAKVTLREEQNGRITIQMTGQGFYSRAATKEKGADENTYELTVRGGRVKKDLPPFVMAAIAKAYGAGNIPGPDTPVEAAVGMLFPPLVGLVVSIIQGLLKPKELVPKLSVGEESMKAANQSMGRGLVSEEEIKAWTAVADALGASGGDEQDAISIGDNELPGGDDYVAPKPEATGSFGEYEGPEEDVSFGKPDPTPDVPSNESQGQQEVGDYTPNSEPESYTHTLPVEPESMVVQTSPRGAETLVVRDPATGQWVNAETGNPFDLDDHQKNIPQQTKEYENYVKRNDELEKTGQSAMQQALDNIDKKHRQEIEAIQKEIDKRRMEQLRRNQESLEWEQQQARKLSGIGRIAGDWVVGMGNDVVDLSKAGKDAVVSVGEKAGTVAGRLVYDPDGVAKDIEDAYNSAKKSLGSAKDKVVGKAKEVYNKPWIAVKGVMETGKSAIDFATNPKKQLEFVKEAIGINDFEASWDPNLPITERFKKVISGTFKLGTTIGTAGTGTAAKTAVGTAGRVAATGAKTAKSGIKVVRGVSKVTKGTKIIAIKGIKPSLPIKRGTNYVAARRAADLKGVTKTAQKVVQNVADDMGLQIKARNIKSANAGRMIDAGKAVPKRVNMKAKTLSIMDEMLGGPKNSDGLVGYYKPKLPPKKVWNSLSIKTKRELTDLYKTRHREFRKLEGTMKELQAAGEYKIEGGLVRDLRQGGKYVTSDLDIHDITNFDGSPVSEGVKKQAYNRMMNYGRVNGKPPVQSTIMHEGTMSWTAESDKLNFSEKAKQGLIDGATKEGPGKGITSFNPFAKPTAERYVRG